MTEFLLVNPVDAMADRLVQESVRGLLGELPAPGPFLLEPLPGGRNNRVYRVGCGEQVWLLKWYFSHPDDQRPRLATEYAFCELCWRHGLRWTPQPLTAAPEQHIAIYSWLRGRKLNAGEVTSGHIQQAFDFLQELNALRGTDAAARLPLASEACLCWNDHLERVEQRVRRLESTLQPADEMAQQAAVFIQACLRPAWERLHEKLLHHAAALRIETGQEFAPGDRCLSPSDFGFHNALVDESGRLRWIDFEYAGWDDPAKLLGDFFSQPAVPAPQEYWEPVLTRLCAWVDQPEQLRQRAELLLPLYRIKWACIVLNEFIPRDHQRRVFSRTIEQAQDATQRSALLANQLRIAKHFLNLANGLE
jgi:hypothetical protein